MLENVVLDMGNVLLDFDPGYALRSFCTNDASRGVIRRELFEGPEWKMGDLGLITNEQRLPLVMQRVPQAYHAELAQCVERWDECMIPLPGAREFLRDVKKRGLGVYVLSNACSRFYSYFPKQFPLSFFDGVLVSSDVHLVKPDKRIYALFLSRFSLDPAACLFVDDMPANTDAARDAGMQAYRFDGDFARLLSHIDECGQIL